LHERLKLAAGERGVSVTREICDRAIDSLESKPKLPPPAPKKRRIDELQDELRKRDETIELLTQALKRDQEPTQLRDLSDTTQEPEHTGPLRHLVYEVPEAGAKLGLNRNASYGAAKRGEIPTIKIGRLLKVPKAAFHAKFGGQPS
jgi:hypothetical protein